MVVIVVIVVAEADRHAAAAGGQRGAQEQGTNPFGEAVQGLQAGGRAHGVSL
jgi:hypothetical protein